MRDHLNAALRCAVWYHGEQIDKMGAPYILHPVRVALQMESPEEKITALLHDLFEDTDARLEDLGAIGADPVIREALVALTRRRDEAYGTYIERVGANPLARRVKLADLEDNLDPHRLNWLPPADQQRLRQKYQTARARLLEVDHAWRRAQGC